MNPARRVIVNTGILYARMAVTVFLSLYTTRVVLSALGVGDFGIFNLVGGTIAMLTFLNASMAAATQRFMSFAQGQGDAVRQHQIFNISVILHAGIALLVVGILEGVGFLLFDGVLKIEPDRLKAAWLVYQFAAASTFFTILAVPYDAVINAREHMLLFAVLGVVEAVLKLAIALVVLKASSDKLVLYGLLMAALSIVLLLLRVGYCTRKYPECKFSPSRFFDRMICKEMTGFSGWSLLGSSTSMFMHYGQGLVLNTFFGARVNAAQGIVSQVSGQLSVLANVMLRALNPMIAKSEGEGNRELMLKATIIGSKMGFYLLAIIYVPVMAELPYLFSLWLTEVPEYAIIFCYLLLLRNLIEQLFITLAASISAIGRIKAFQLTNSILTLVPLPVTYILFKSGFQPYSIYIVFIVYSLVTFASVIYFSKKLCELPVRSYLRNAVFRCFFIFFVSLAAGSLPTWIFEPGFSRLIAVVFVSVITVITLIWTIGVSAQERAEITKLLLVIRGRIMKRQVLSPP